MTEEDIHAAAPADPDAQSLTEQEMARKKRAPPTKTLCGSLALTQ
jgi:hypothetical protein